MEEELKDVVTMRQLLECGVHFGHQTKRWDPRMKKYIFTSRNGIHVIDLQQSIKLIKVAYEFVKEVSKNTGIVLFVGTKKQAQESIKEESIRCDMPYIDNRWLGGTLTNISTIRKSINKIKDFERKKEEGIFDQLSNKEQSKKLKAYNKLLLNLRGIKDMIKTPSALFVVDTKKEHIAIKEARKLGIPIIGVVDTNANPDEVDYPIPANDDAIRAVKLLCSIMANAVIAGQKEQASVSAKAAEKAETPPAETAAQEAATEKKAAPQKEAEKKAPAKKAVAKKTTVKKETAEEKPAEKKAAKAKKEEKTEAAESKKETAKS